MFAYCGNNPIARVDVSGKVWELAFYWEYTIHKAETEVKEESDGGKTYCTTITYSTTMRSYFGCLADETTFLYEVPFEYKVTDDGVILYDNQHLASSHLGVVLVRETLAKEMLQITQSQTDNALQSRTVSGISEELLLHYVFYKKGILSDNARIANIGGLGNVGRDSNAWLFELLFGWVEHFF